MISVCIDTNVWVSGLAFKGIPAEIVTLALEHRFQVVCSSHILDELEHVLIHKIGMGARNVKRLRFRISQIANLYEAKGQVRIVPNNHPDNLVLETAVLGDSKYLVTGDRQHLLPLKIFRNVRIVEPAGFLAHFKK